MSKRFFVADLHFGHVKVAKLRYPAMAEDPLVVTHHDMVIYDQLKMLNADDQVWILGDISSGKPDEEDRALQLLSEFSAQLHLIAGNHDSVSSIHRNGFKSQRRWLEVFDSVQQFGRIRLQGENVLMSHYPYARSGDGPGRGEARHSEFRLPDVGYKLIHGHTHHNEKHMNLYGDWEDKILKSNERKVLDTQQYCVSWDSHRGLVTESQLNTWIKETK